MHAFILWLEENSTNELLVPKYTFLILVFEFKVNFHYQFYIVNYRSIKLKF